MIFQLLIEPQADPTYSKKIFTAILLTMCVNFGLVLTIIGIVLDLAVSRFTGNVAGIFFKVINI